MPLEVLTGIKPDLSNMCPWGYKVWIYDTSSSKLDKRAKEGWWVGFDKESKAHRIYYPGKRLVGVERSIVFIPEDVEVILESLPLEGKDNKLDEQDEVEDGDEKGKGRRINAKNECSASPKPNETPVSEENTDREVPATTQQPTIEHEPVLKGQGHHICKESAYIRQI